jgi:hypothetical protein
MTSVATIVRDGVAVNFNNVLGEFMRKLMTTFPGDEAAFKFIYNKMLLAITADKTIVVSEMAKELDTHGPRIKAKDEQLFAKSSNITQLPVFSDVDMCRNWQACSADTKEAMWGYLNVLVDLCTAYQTAGGISNDARYDQEMADVASAMPELTEMAERMQHAIRRTQSASSSSSAPASGSAFITQVAKDIGIDLSWLAKVDLDDKVDEIKASIHMLLPNDKATADTVLDKVMGEMRKIRKQQIREAQSSVVGTGRANTNNKKKKKKKQPTLANEQTTAQKQ